MFLIIPHNTFYALYGTSNNFLIFTLKDFRAPYVCSHLYLYFERPVNPPWLSMCRVTCNRPTIITKCRQRPILYRGVGCTWRDQLTLPSNARLTMNIRAHVLTPRDVVLVVGWWWATIFTTTPNSIHPLMCTNFLLWLGHQPLLYTIFSMEFHKVIQIHNNVLWDCTFNPNVKNIPQNNVNPTKQCYGFE